MSDNAVTGRLRRLFSMSGDEFVTRSRQELGKRIDDVLARAGNNFSEAPRTSGCHPKFFFALEEVPAILSFLRQRLPDEYNQIPTRAERICAHHFDLLGYRNLDYGKAIDWHLDRVHGRRSPRRAFYKIHYLDFEECGDVKVTWELNRHQHFLTLAKAYRITGEQRFADEIFTQWEHWHRQNPYPYGVNWASSLEFAFRSLSWLWTYHLLGESTQRRAGFREQFLRSLSVHARAIERYISTYFSPNTHLLGEAVALFFIGVLCPELPSAERWKNFGWKITLQQAQRQVRPDGLHFEQSLYYHVYATDFFLHARILASRNEVPVPAGYDATLERMLNALSIVGRTGNVPQIGDDDGGRLFDGQRNRSEHMLDPLATGAALFRRGEFKALAQGLREETLWLLGLEGASAFDAVAEQPPRAESTALPDSGLYLMNDSCRQIVIDAGPLGSGSGGHGHADALSILVSDRSGPVLIDPGTYEYVGDGLERNQYRTTEAHNTLTIDGITQPQPRGPFAWSHHQTSVCEKWINGEQFDLFVGSHNAYAPLMHRRFVFSRKSSLWLVRDVVEGTGKHQIDSYWHFAPEFTSLNGVFSRIDNSGLEVITADDIGRNRMVEAGTCSPAYGESQPASVLHFSTVVSLPTEFATLFRSHQKANAKAESLEALGPGIGLREYAHADDEEEHRFLFAGGNHGCTLQGWSSDAEFLYWGYDRRRERGLLIFCAGTTVTFNGCCVVECAEPVASCEVIWENGRAQVRGTRREGIAVHDTGFSSLMAEPELSASARKRASE